MPDDLERQFNKSSFSAKDACAKLGISYRKLLHFEKYGIVHPARYRHKSRIYRKYSELDISRANFINILISKNRLALAQAKRKLEHIC